MIAEDAIRFLAHQARRCRDRDTAEAICLLLPAMMQLLYLEPMDDVDAAYFGHEIKRELREQENPQPVLTS